jgi:hypothetical protein
VRKITKNSQIKRKNVSETVKKRLYNSGEKSLQMKVPLLEVLKNFLNIGLAGQSQTREGRGLVRTQNFTNL